MIRRMNAANDQNATIGGSGLNDEDGSVTVIAAGAAGKSGTIEVAARIESHGANRIYAVTVREFEVVDRAIRPPAITPGREFPNGAGIVLATEGCYAIDVARRIENWSFPLAVDAIIGFACDGWDTREIMKGGFGPRAIPCWR
jgi:hypothetical protein